MWLEGGTVTIICRNLKATLTEIWNGTVCGPNAHGFFPTKEYNPALQDWIAGVRFLSRLVFDFQSPIIEPFSARENLQKCVRACLDWDQVRPPQ